MGNDSPPTSHGDEYEDITERPDSIGAPSRSSAGPLRENGNSDHLTVGSGGRQGKKRLNPLVDLIQTEKSYVDLLAAIIRKVASAWSRANFPPPELDAVFRAVEVVYRANRALLASLNEIGPNPTSPKALGDLLMRWIDDLEAPYTRYCEGYATSFDTWLPVQNNPNLQPILEEISTNIPPSSYSASLDPVWTLDNLFLMPATRVKYYKKLYTRLLKSTQPGRSDHKLLLGANERLTRLLGTVEARSVIRVGDVDRNSAPPSEEPLFSPPPRKSSAAPISPALPTPPPEAPPKFAPALLPKSTAEHESPHPPLPERESQAESSSSGRMSRDTEGRDSGHSAPTSSTSAPARTSTSTLTSPITDLERRLTTERVIDIFTMTPRKCRLQMAPPNLGFTRKLRFSADVVITFVPRSTGVEVVHRHAHIYLLTDLFLVCERMSEEDRRGEGREGFDMWLSYPPLSTKHLLATDVPGPIDNLFELRIMKKEVLTIHADSRAAKEAMLQDFLEARDDSSNLLGPSPIRGPTNGPPPSDSFPPRGSSVGAGGPQRSRTQPPQEAFSRSLSGGPPTPMDEFDGPPRPAFGRLAAGSDPNLPASGSGDPNGGEFRPPPRGTSRGLGPGPGGQPGPRADSTPPDFRGMDSAPPLRLNGNNLGPGGHQHGHLADPNGYPPLPLSPLPPMNDPRGDPRQVSFNNQPHPRSLDPKPELPPINFQGQPRSRGPPNPAFNGGPPPRVDSSGFPQNGMYSGSGAPSMRSIATSSSQSREPSMVSSASLSMSSRQPPRLQMGIGPSPAGDSPPSSPDEETRRKDLGPVTSTITAQMKCKVFLKQHHASWKALGNAKLLLYQQQPTNAKQLVVEADSKAKTLIISTIVLMDAVERVGKTGVAIELSDGGQRTGIVYMIQLKSEQSAFGFFTTLLAGSDRTIAQH